MGAPGTIDRGSLDSDNLIVVEGRWAVEALLDSRHFTARRVFLERGRHEDIRDKIHVPLVELSGEELSDRAGFSFHRGIYAEADRPEARELNPEFLTGAKRLVVPVCIADPGNLGTIVRTAAAFGADGILVERGKGADIYGRKAIRASARAIFRLPVFECADLVGTIKLLQGAGFGVLATGLGEVSQPLQQIGRFEKSAVLFGAEEAGLRPEVLDRCDQSVRIPMAEGTDSLNVAASAAIVLWELFGRECSPT